MDNKQKHLEFIQAIIARMAGNLFFLKGWVITLVAALLTLATSNNKGYIFISYLVAIMFWILDGYFLSQERLFRALYNHVRKLEEKDIDFSMDTDEYKKVGKNSWILSVFSPTLSCFYGSLIVIMLLITILIN